MNGTYSLPSAPPAREQTVTSSFMMLPLLVVACYLYGGRPAVMCCVAVATAVVCDHLTAWMRGRTHDSAENSSIPMALVTTMMLPASVSYYIVIVAVAVGVCWQSSRSAAGANTPSIPLRWAMRWLR